jgi:hypothetical protein
MNMDFRHRRPGSCSSGLILGIGVILLGVVFLLEQIPGFEGSRLLGFLKDLWPLILVAMGAARIQRGRRPSHGWVLLVVGLFLLAVTLGHGRFDAFVWPAMLVCAGIFIVLRALNRQRRMMPEISETEDYMRSTAVMSGFKHKILSQAFKGGELTAIFGGFDIDLRQVVMEGESARIDVFLLFGGGEIRVPENWEVLIQTTAIAGGIGDKKLFPSAQNPRPKLILTGTIFFGGIEVKN